MKYFYFLLLLGVAVPSTLAGGMCGNLSDLKTIICHTFKSYFAKVLPPKVHVAIYLVDQFFDANKKSVWQQVKDNVEKYVDDQLTGAAWDDIQKWYESMVRRVDTCKIKTNKKFKIECLKNLQQDLSGYEPQFHGDTLKETALFIKYYDIFSFTFFAISDELRDLTDDEEYKKSIDKDVIAKAQIFSAYLEKAIEEAKYYACRHIKIRIESEGIFWGLEEYWPSDVESREIPASFGSRKRSAEESETDDDADEEVDDIADKRRGCGPFKSSHRMRACVYDMKTDSQLSTYNTVDKCDRKQAISAALATSLPAWGAYTKRCTKKLKTNFFRDLESRLEYIKDLASKEL